jgi:hypothetical protein
MIFILRVCAGNADREGVHFGTSFSPGIAYSLVFTSINDSREMFPSTLGSLGAGLQLAFSKNGKNIHSAHAAFCWNYPSSWFLGDIYAGYSFVHYLQGRFPSLACGLEANAGLHLNKFDARSYVPELQLGVRAGYDLTKHITCWIGYLPGLEYRRYAVDGTYVSFYDLTDLELYSGTYYVKEYIFSNRIQLSLTYLF